MPHPGLMELARRDQRFSYEAYEFLFESLAHTQERLGRTPPENPDKPPGPEYHVSGQELVEGFLDLAKQRFGRLARVVLQLWGINSTGDIGEVVFNLINGELLSKNENDSIADFQNLFNLDDVLVRDYQIVLEQ